MNRLFLSSVALVVAGSVAGAQAEDAQSQVDAVIAKYDEARQAYSEAYSAATTDEERNAARELAPDSATYAPELWTIVEANAGSAASRSALAWIARYSRTDGARVLDELVDHHLDQEEIASIVSAVSLDAAGAPAMHVLLEKSPSAEVQGLACFALGRHEKSLAGLAETVKTLDESMRERYEAFYGKEVLEAVAESGPEPHTAKARAYFERVVADYSEVQGSRAPLADSAKGELFEMENLVIGKVAPDIEGEDIDGVAFKLSDYRGKVVVLDFWGDW